MQVIRVNSLSRSQPDPHGLSYFVIPSIYCTQGSKVEIELMWVFRHIFVLRCMFFSEFQLLIQL